MLEFDKNLTDYAERHTSPEDKVLYELNRETHLKFNFPQMVSGHFQGKVLTMLTQMIRPKRILEIGTFTGYSTICFAQGLGEDGLIHSIDINEELEATVRKYLKKANVERKVQLYFGDAMEIIPTLDEPFDLVFIDADKSNYINYYDLVFDKVTTGGYILADNVLWSGRVWNMDKDKRTKIIDAYNKKVQNDDRVENILLPIRDGIMIARKL